MTPQPPPPPNPPRPKLPPPIPGYTLIKRLDRGGFGVVYLARSTTEVYHAVKFIEEGHISDIEFDGLCTYEKHVTDFRHLVRILFVDRIDGWVYYTMELAKDCPMNLTFNALDYRPRTLAYDLGRGPMAVEEAVRIILAILEGLQHLHGLGLLHRDVKPKNILFFADGDGMTPKLADIGLVASARHQWNNAFCADYAPPGGVRSASDDLFCVVTTLYEMVTGMHPGRFPELPDAPSTQVLDAVRVLRPVFDCGCHPDPDERYQRVDKLVTALDHAMASLAPEVVAPAAEPEATIEPVGAPRRGVMAALAIFIVGALALFPALVGPLAATGTAATRAGHEHLRLMMSPFAGAPWVPLTKDTIPLEVGNEVRLEIALDRPGYPVLFCGNRTADGAIDGGKLECLYPLPEHDPEQLRTLNLPMTADQAEAWPVEPPDGTLIFILLVASEPVADVDALRIAIQGLGRLPVTDADSMFVLAPDGAVRREVSRTRSINTGAPRRSEPNLLNELHTAFAAQYDTVTAVAIPQVTRGEGG